MRVNVYAEEMTDRIEIISKVIEGQTFTGLRFYLELPVTMRGPPDPQTARLTASNDSVRMGEQMRGSFGHISQVAGPFIHHPGDDDSAAVTFWGKRDLREMLRLAMLALDSHYAEQQETT